MSNTLGGWSQSLLSLLLAEEFLARVDQASDVHMDHAAGHAGHWPICLSFHPLTPGTQEQQISGFRPCSLATLEPPFGCSGYWRALTWYLAH